MGADEATFDRYNWGWPGREIKTLGNAGLQIGPPLHRPRRCSTGVRPRVGLGIRVATARRAFGCFRLAFKTYRAPRRLGLNSDVILPDGSDLSAQKLGRAPVSPPCPNALATHKGVSLIGLGSTAKPPEFATPVSSPPNVPGMTATVAHVKSLPLSLTMPSKYSAQFPHRLEKIETIDKAIETSADGRPAPIRAGGIHDPAGWMDDTASARMLTALGPKARIATDPLPEGLRRPDTETHRFLFNCNALYVEWDGNTIADAGVSWQKNSAQRGRNPSRPGPKTADD